MTRLRHAARLTSDLLSYCTVNRKWWLVPVVLLAVLLGGLVSVGAATVPYSVYTIL